MRLAMEFEDAIRAYKRILLGADPMFHLPAALPSAAQSHRRDDTWYLRDAEGRLIARVTPAGVRLG